jgi:manganese-dependent ADP-ribose/CDP-alcohol diphosphatase
MIHSFWHIFSSSRDLVDGKCQNVVLNGGDPPPDGVDSGHQAVDDVISALSAYQNGPILHIYGNHCLHNMDRPTLASKLGITLVKEPCGDLVGYSCYKHKSMNFITLDSYDVAIPQRCAKTSAKGKLAAAILKKNNPNYEENINSPEGLVGVQQRYVGFNGAVGSVQLEWLENELDQARKRQERCIIISHQPILPGSTSPVCLMWNYKEVLAVLRRYKDVVVASFSGHAHKGGYLRDTMSGIHFRVVEAVLESPAPHKTYAMIDVYKDRLQVRGFGHCKSAIYEFDHQPLSTTVEREQPAGQPTATAADSVAKEEER